MEINPSVAESLAAVSSSRAEVADRLVTPWWYHPALGALGSFQVLAVGKVFGTIGMALFVVVTVLGPMYLMSRYREMTGVELADNPGSGRATRGLAWVMFGLLGAGVLVSVVAGWFFEILWVPWVVAIYQFVATVVVGRAYDRALRAELRSSLA